jgi:hypothetical protein
LGNRPAPEEWAAVLDAAIRRVTRAIVSADDEVLLELVAERRAMREELAGIGRGRALESDVVTRRAQLRGTRRRRGKGTTRARHVSGPPAACAPFKDPDEN